MVINASSSPSPLSAPFPYFGGKSRVAAAVWQRFGAHECSHFIEPFFGSGAVLLQRPHGAPQPTWLETVNDFDGLLVNAWRAMRAAPQALAEAIASTPPSELDLHARHFQLVQASATLRNTLLVDPLAFVPELAAWWLWGINLWVGSGWCSGNGPWGVGADGAWQRVPANGVRMQRPHLSTCGQGVNKASAASGQLVTWFQALQQRLARVRILCGDWQRVVSPAVLGAGNGGATCVFLDPPYGEERDVLYANDDMAVHHDVRAWALANGNQPNLRIALCGYKHEHAMPDDWECFEWQASGGYGNQGDGRGRANKHLECIWFSPHCHVP